MCEVPQWVIYNKKIYRLMFAKLGRCISTNVSFLLNVLDGAVTPSHDNTCIFHNAPKRTSFPQINTQQFHHLLRIRFYNHLIETSLEYDS